MRARCVGRVTSFDFLHGDRTTALRRLRDFRLPPRLHSSVIALIVACLTALGAWGIESYRLRAALQLQSLYEMRFHESEQAVAQSRIRYQRLAQRAALDQRIRDVRGSGHLDAQRVAEIANRLPPHMWLTSITHDATGISLEGRVQNLVSLGTAIDSLSRSGRLRNAVLISANAEEEAGSTHRVLRYQLHVDGVR